MSSSGLIYAVIVGAWAVYLVPMWLRREDELNRARHTQRYSAAIKVLSNKEAFERRWAKTAEATIELPLAVGQNLLPQTRSAARPKKPAAKSAAKPIVATARPEARPTRTTKPTASSPTPATAKAKTKPTSKPAPGKRLGLMARRRRVVTLLFGMSTLGALVTADLGTGYLWAMAMPAALLSVYIVRLRREERTRASDRARRRALADEARHRAQAQNKAKAQARAQVEAEAEARAEAELEVYDRRQAQAAARRRTAAARARAQSFTPQDAADLRRASNG